MERHDQQRYVDAINMLKRAFGKGSEKARYIEGFCYESFHEGDDTGYLEGAFEAWSWSLEFRIHDDGVVRSDMEAICDRDDLSIVQFISGPVDASRFFRNVLARPGKEGFIDPERLKAMIPGIVRQARENLEAALGEMRKNPGAVFARGLLLALRDIFPLGKATHASHDCLLMEGTVADFAQAALFPDICASFDHDLAMDCRVDTEGSGRLYSYHVFIRITHRDGRRIACGSGSLTEELAKDPLERIAEVIGFMRDPAKFRADTLA